MIKTLCYSVSYRDIFRLGITVWDVAYADFFVLSPETRLYSGMTPTKQTYAKMLVVLVCRLNHTKTGHLERFTAEEEPCVGDQYGFFFFYKITLSHCPYYLFQERNLLK